MLPIRSGRRSAVTTSASGCEYIRQNTADATRAQVRRALKLGTQKEQKARSDEMLSDFIDPHSLDDSKSLFVKSLFAEALDSGRCVATDDPRLKKVK